MNLSIFSKEINEIKKWKPRLSGRVTQVIGLLIESSGPEVFVGEICMIYGRGKKAPIPSQVVGFKEQKVLLMPLGEIFQIAPGAEVYPTGEMHRVAVSDHLVGRVLNALGEPMDGKGKLIAETFYPVMASPPPPLSRKPIEEVLPTGIKAIDALCTLGRGQRIGIFSGPGIGKSTLMGMIAKMAQADVTVIALIGERGREVKEFIDRELGAEGLAKCIIVAATSDQPALLRCKGANVATAIAEYFRDQGKNVILMMDSVSRYAMALREIGLAIGEPPTTRGYTPSVFADLPRLLERAGNSDQGSITGIYTILCEEEEFHDPIPDQMRSLLDGHIHLSSKLAQASQFPPIDVLKSLSRLMVHVTSADHQKLARKFRMMLHTYQEAEELINLGAYISGSNPKIDEAVEKIDALRSFLTQEAHQFLDFDKMMEALTRITI